MSQKQAKVLIEQLMLNGVEVYLTEEGLRYLFEGTLNNDEVVEGSAS